MSWEENCRQAAIISDLGRLQQLFKNRRAVPKDLLLLTCREDLSGKCAEFLLQKKADPNQVGPGGNTPLHVASYRGNVNAVRALLKAGSSPSALDNNQADPIFYTVQATVNSVAVGTLQDFTTILQLYHEHNFDILHAKSKGIVVPTIQVASEVGHMPIIDLLLSLNADVNEPFSTTGATALHFAVQSGNFEVVRKLLNAGANTRARQWEILRDGTPSGTLPIEKVLSNFNFRIANAIFAHEEKLNLPEIEYPPVPAGLIHTSEANVNSIRQLVTNCKDKGSSASSGEKKTRRVCAYCEMTHYEMKACSACKSVYYCDRSCQVTHWKDHKLVCSK